MKQLTEVVPISPSTLKRELTQIHEVYQEYTIKKHENYENRFINDLDFETHVKSKLIERGLLAERDQFNDMERDEFLSKAGQVFEMNPMNSPDPEILNPGLISAMSVKECNSYYICTYCK